MIRVTVELWPWGDESKKRLLATADVFNNKRGDTHTGYYGFRIRNAGGRMMREGTMINGYKRRYTVWWLLANILHAAFPDKDKTLVK